MYDNGFVKREHQLSVRITKRLYETLVKQAKTERRSIADVVNIRLEDSFASGAKASEQKR
jgi:hypothetical protein